MTQAIVPAASGGEGSRFLVVFHRRPCRPCFQSPIRRTALKRRSSAPFVATASTGIASVILQWEAARVLGQLARVDAEEKFAATLASCFLPLAVQ
jgi:hypothetical protein